MQLKDRKGAKISSFIYPQLFKRYVKRNTTQSIGAKDQNNCQRYFHITELLIAYFFSAISRAAIIAEQSIATVTDS
jgi:hypothetical protein